MALRAMYKGIKKVLAPLIIKRPGELAIDQDALNTELNIVFFPRNEQAVLGAKNFYYMADNTATSNGITYTVSDNILTISGQATADSYSQIAREIFMPKGEYIINGLSGGSAQTYYIDILNHLGNVRLARLTDGDVALSLAQDTYLDVYPNVKSGVDLSTVITVKIMIRLATDHDTTYVPYAMTNKELTDRVAELATSAADQKTAINAIITAATGAADFAAFKTAMGAITPVTRSLSLTKEDITEEVKEDVEPEKTVTKKRTTKKTEEV